VKRIIAGLLSMICVYASPSLAWNALGHALVAQIAVDKLKPAAKAKCLYYHHAFDSIDRPMSFVQSAVWLDRVRYQDVPWYSSLHYLDWPISEKDEPVPSDKGNNAVWAIEMAVQTLQGHYAQRFQKGLALRILLHVLADLHQPLHAATRVSQAYPEGDKGGNLLLLKGNKEANNLHAYWDRGGGLLRFKPKAQRRSIEAWAKQIEEKWPCEQLNSNDLNPKHWAAESHHLASTVVYHLPMDKQYQKNAQLICEKQIALAGCRLGLLLNTLF
jgi:hypothetical protein